MRFAHRRAAKDAGGLSRQKGGFSETPPANPPVKKQSNLSYLEEDEGELGGFSDPLYARTANYIGPADNIPFYAAVGDDPTPTPPGDPFLPDKPLEQRAFRRGGVFGETPPAEREGRIPALGDIPANIGASTPTRIAQKNAAPSVETDSTPSWFDLITLPDPVGLWADAVRLRSDMAPPTSISAARWQQVTDDAARFISDWGAQASALGWGEQHLFSVPPGPERWLNRTGVIGLLRGRTVIAITADAITIANPRGASNIYRRCKLSGAVMLWAANAYSENFEETYR